jgi:hypothetical protein
MALPRDAIGLPESDLDRWMHRVYPAARGPGSVLSHFVVSTVSQAAQPGAAAAAKLGEAGSTLLAGLLLDDGDLTGAGAPGDMRAHVTGYVRAHLGEPGCPGPASPRRITCHPGRWTGCSRTSRGRSAA